MKMLTAINAEVKNSEQINYIVLDVAFINEVVSENMIEWDQMK